MSISPADPHPDAPLASLEGTVERVTFHSDETGYTVLRLAVPGRSDVVTAVGSFTNPSPGENLVLFGQWTTHPQYGPQFRMERYQVMRPATLVGIERYLGSGLIKGIGPVTAKRMVKQFGLETLAVIEQNPQRLSEVPGVGPKRIDLIARAWREQKEVQNIMLFLQSHGVSTAFAVKIYKNYGDRAIEILEENPYRLTEIWGIGFKSADRIARALGLAADAPARLQSGLLYVLNNAADGGHCYLPAAELVSAAARELAVEEAALEPALRDLIAREGVIAEGPAAGSPPAPSLSDLELSLDGSGPSASAGAPAEAAPPSSEPAIYVPSLYHTERGVAQRLSDLLAIPPVRDMAASDPEGWVADWMQRSRVRLSAQQREAVLKALTQKALVLTGGPGTGKTTATRAIVQLFHTLGKSVLLTSPTGRAAKRLSEVTGTPAKTIHRLLEFDPSTMGFKRGPEDPLDGDVIIVDEASMLDVVLFYSLLKAVPLRSRLVLVGDVDQLPSVGPGNVLRDVIDSGAVPVVRLTEVFRQAAASAIITNAHRVNQGQMPDLVPPQQANGRDCVYIAEEEPERIVELVSAVVRTSLPRRGFSPDDIQVLCPMNRGLVGAGHLNSLLQSVLNPASGRPGAPEREVHRAGRTFRVGDRVLQLVNNYTKGVFNGDVGRVAGLDEEEQILRVAYPDQEVSYDFAEMDELQLAYALSVHKSQGSEYPAVVIPVHTQHYMMLQRNVLYTALTRAKRMAVLVGSKRAIAMAVRNNRQTVRYTRLTDRLTRQL